MTRKQAEARVVKDSFEEWFQREYPVFNETDRYSYFKNAVKFAWESAMKAALARKEKK
jgi:hypothetical protein